MIAVMTLLRTGLFYLAALVGALMMMEMLRGPATPAAVTPTVMTLSIGEASEARVEPWCQSSLGQVSVRGVVFVSGAVEPRACPPANKPGDTSALATLDSHTNWNGPLRPVTFLDAGK